MVKELLHLHTTNVELRKSCELEKIKCLKGAKAKGMPWLIPNQRQKPRISKCGRQNWESIVTSF